jgi:hypothetical protein
LYQRRFWNTEPQAIAWFQVTIGFDDYRSGSITQQSTQRTGATTLVQFATGADRATFQPEFDLPAFTARDNC